MSGVRQALLGSMDLESWEEEMEFLLWVWMIKEPVERRDRQHMDSCRKEALKAPSARASCLPPASLSWGGREWLPSDTSERNLMLRRTWCFYLPWIRMSRHKAHGSWDVVGGFREAGRVISVLGGWAKLFHSLSQFPKCRDILPAPDFWVPITQWSKPGASLENTVVFSHMLNDDGQESTGFIGERGKYAGSEFG